MGTTAVETYIISITYKWTDSTVSWKFCTKYSLCMCHGRHMKNFLFLKKLFTENKTAMCHTEIITHINW